MKKERKSVSIVVVVMLLVNVLIGIQPVFAADSQISIYNVSYTESKVSKGSSIFIAFDCYPMSEETKITGVELSGNAVDKTKMRYDITDGAGNAVETLSVGQVAHVEISGLTYTGEGTEVTMALQYQGGKAEHTITLNAITNDNVVGALVLDSSVESNMSIQMNAGESKKFSLQLKNVSSETIKNGVLKIALAETTVGLAVTDGQYIEIASMNTGSTKTVNFTVTADSKVKAGQYKINAEINGLKQTILLDIGSDTTPASLELSIPAGKQFTSGEINTLLLEVKNNGKEKAQNIKLEIKNKDTVAVVGNSNVKYLTDIVAGGSSNVSMQVQLDNTSTSMILLEVGLSYKTASGESISDTQLIYLPTDSIASASDVRIIGVSGPSGSYPTQQDFKVKFTVASDSAAKDLKVSVTPTANSIVAKSQSVFILPTLSAGGSKAYEVSFAATDEATTNNYPIEIAVEYTYNQEKIQQKQYVGVNIINDDSSSASTPKVIVDNFTITPDVAQAGEAVSIAVDLRNTHAAKKITNLIATYSIPEDSSNLFTPVGSGNTLFTNSIGAGSTQTQVITFNTTDALTSKTYQMTIDLEYEDEDGNQYKMTQSVGIPIGQSSGIEIGEVDASSLVIGKSTGVTVTLYNRSKADISNVMVFVEGEGFTVKDNKSYISTFSKGATEYYLPTITATDSDGFHVELVIQYEDSRGEMQEIREPLALTVGAGTTRGEQSTMPEGMGGMPPGMGGKQGAGSTSGESGSAVNYWMIGGGFVAMAALSGALYVVLKKRKQLKAITFDE